VAGSVLRHATETPSRIPQDLLFDVATFAPEAAFDLSAAVVADLHDGLAGITEGKRPNPDDIESGLSAADVPALADHEVDVSIPAAPPVDLGEAETMLDVGGEAVAIAAETSGEAATVVLEAGGEAVAVVIEEGGEAAAEATAEVLVAALDGV